MSVAKSNGRRQKVKRKKGLTLLGDIFPEIQASFHDHPNPNPGSNPGREGGKEGGSVRFTWKEGRKATPCCIMFGLFFNPSPLLLLCVAPPSSAGSPRLRKLLPAVGVSMSVYYLLHISFMWFVKFDYGYNMKVHAVGGMRTSKGVSLLRS